VETPRLSKSRVQSGAQCVLRLWNERNAPELATPPGDAQQYLFDRGREIGELARERYPGGSLIAADHRQTDLALSQTAEKLSQSPLPILFEPAFLHRNVLVRVDVLRPVGAEGFDLIEVKSATKAKEVYLRDVAIQYWILRGAGAPLREAGLLLLDRSYTFDGRRLDLDRLFVFTDLSTQIGELQEEVETLVDELQSLLRRHEPPEIQPGPQCVDPYECPFLAHCSADLTPAEHPVSELPRLRKERQLELREMGVDEIAEIPDAFSLNPLQQRVRRCVREQRDWIGSGLGDALGSIRHPVHHLDFEAFMPAIPLYEGTHPFDALPFQYSIHRESESGDLEHLEYLCRDRSDPRRPLAEQLLADLGSEGSICVYAPYEKGIITALAKTFPDLQGPLEALLRRIWDLLPVIRGNYYHPDFHGSFSIKTVLPVLVPELSYEGLEISDGMAAARQYEATLETADEDARRDVFESLLQYCGLDTEAMVRLRAALAKRVGDP